MSAVQTEYNERIPAGQVGQPAEPNYEADSRVVETAAGIGFGLAVSRGSGERGVVLGGSQFAGVSLRDITVPPASDADEYQRYQNIGVLTRGCVWVSPSTDVEAGQEVAYDTTTGRFSDSEGTTVEGAIWESSASADGLAKLRLRGAPPAAAATT